jgi:hypothetical protein
MPIRQYIDSKAFDPDTIRVMSAALERALTALKIEDRSDPRAETVARRIILAAEKGEQDPAKLCEIVLKSVRE